MLNIFIWVARLILAVFIIVGISYLVLMVQCGVLSLIDYIHSSNKLESFDLYENFKNNLFILSFVMAIKIQMKNIKFNKEPKGIYKLLARWRKERNITNPNYYTYCSSIIEELLEPLYDDKKTIKNIQTKILDDYFYIDEELNENKIVDTICDIKVFSINELGTMKYNGKKCMKETIKEISSRIQDSQQKEEWEEKGAKGKWQKWQEQPKETLYIANYTKCKL